MKQEGKRLRLTEEEIASSKNINYSIPKELEEYTANLFKGICLEKLEVWNHEE